MYSDKPLSATVSKKGRVVYLNWEKTNNSKYYVLYRFGKREVLNLQNPEKILMVTGETLVELEKNRATNPRKYVYVVSAINHWNHESEGVVLERK
jgi:hypothetical protein